MSNKQLGAYGEKLAEDFLISKGFQFIERNFRTNLGEVDLIFMDRKTLVFIEVKTRKSLKYGQPFEAVNQIKIHKLSKLAESYMKLRFKNVDMHLRFDVISLYQDPQGKVTIKHISNAF